MVSNEIATGEGNNVHCSLPNLPNGVKLRSNQTEVQNCRGSNDLKNDGTRINRGGANGFKGTKIQDANGQPSKNGTVDNYIYKFTDIDSLELASKHSSFVAKDIIDVVKQNGCGPTETQNGTDLRKRHCSSNGDNSNKTQDFFIRHSCDNSSGTHGRSYRLVRYESLPAFLHDNEFLVEGHRPVLNSASECFRSILHLHTETWNIWTHLLGAILAILLLVYHMSYADQEGSLAFLFFFCGAVFCQTVSSLYHTLICHSEPVCKLFAKLDYCGVITLTKTSEVAWLHFAFYCRPWLKTSYFALAGVTFTLALCLALQDKFREPAYRWIRFGLFTGLALSASLPTLHYYLLDDASLPATQAPLVWVFVMASFYAAGGFIYVTRVPERFFPGKFDIHCQSHQIMHVCVIAGVICCYIGLYKYSCLRLNAPCPSNAKY